jgi:hypothetical protein
MRVFATAWIYTEKGKMSAFRKSNEVTDQEWDEMMRLYRQTNCNLAVLTTSDLERFSDLFARTLLDKGNPSLKG